MAPLATHERLILFADKSTDPPTASATSYQLLALPPALLALVTASAESGSTTAPLEFRGDPHDSAVLVTETQTYAVRGVQNSNSLCVCASGTGDATRRGRKHWFVPGSGDEQVDAALEDDGEPARKKARHEAIEIEAVLHETLEAVPGVARTDKLDGLLKGAEYLGDAAEEAAETDQDAPRFTFDSLRARLPASDAEIRTALSRRRVVTLDGDLRPLPPSFLLAIFPSILSTLPLPANLAHGPAAASKKKDKGKGKEAKPLVPAAAASAQVLHAEALEVDLLDALDAVDCGNEDVARQLLGWFGDEVEVGGKKRWRLDAAQLVKEVGVALLAGGGFGQQPHDAFLERWKSLAGGFAPICTLSLLAGLHLFRPPPVSTVQYLPPSSLSPDPAARFAELFSLKPKWLEADMSLYIDDLTGGDKKKRDALVLKFVRKVKDKDSTWWTARNLWSA
ncbi:hypothetical protein JCM8208_005165 [Rhodotorula glutinis]